MLKWYNGSLGRLKKIGLDDVNHNFFDLLSDNEIIMSAYHHNRAFVLFTDHRIIVCNMKGLVGKKQDYTSIPYDKITSYAVRAKASLDSDCHLEVSLTGLWKVRFKFSGTCDVKSILKRISFYHQK